MEAKTTCLLDSGSRDASSSFIRMQYNAFLWAIVVNECSKRRTDKYLDHFYPGRMSCCVGLAGGCRGLCGGLCGRFLGDSRHRGQGQDGENRQDGGRTRGGAASLCSSQNPESQSRGEEGCARTQFSLDPSTKYPELCKTSREEGYALESPVSLCEKSSQELKQRVRMSRQFLAEVQKEQQTVALNFGEGRIHVQQASESNSGDICERQTTVEDKEDGN